MNRISTFVWILVIVVASFMLYRVKYEVQSLRSQIADTTKQLRQEKEAMNVVSAEWAYLNRPERLQQLSAKYLSSAGVTVDQIAEVEAIPYPRHLEASAASPSPITPASLKPASSVSIDGGDDQ